MRHPGALVEKPPCLSGSFQAGGGQTSESLAARVHLDAHRFQRGNAQNRLGVVGAENHRRPHHIAHELYSCAGNVHLDFGAVSEFIRAFRLWLDADGLEVLAWHQAIDDPGVDKEQPFLRLVKVGRIANGYGNLRHSHTRHLVVGILLSEHLFGVPRLRGSKRNRLTPELRQYT